MGVAGNGASRTIADNLMCSVVYIYIYIYANFLCVCGCDVCTIIGLLCVLLCRAGFLFWVFPVIFPFKRVFCAGFFPGRFWAQPP